MAMIREATVLLRGMVRTIDYYTAKAGGQYATVQVQNEGGISDVSVSPTDVERLNVHNMPAGAPVAWVVRPYVKYGLIERTGRPYAFLSLIFQQEAD